MKKYAILVSGTLLQLCLGTIYAFSYFQNPLMETYGWSNSQVSMIFSLSILFLGLSAALGGLLIKRFGPRFLAAVGAVLYGAAYLGSSLALRFGSLWGLYLAFGVAGGMGLGLGYVTPVATVTKWFAGKKGFATGAVVMGFGFGALVMSKILAPALMRATGNNLESVFLWTGAVILVCALPAALVLRDPKPGEAGTVSSSADADARTYKAFPSWSFAVYWTVFFCNIVAGIMFISFQSPIYQDYLGGRGLSTAELAAAGATLIAVSSLANGVGRFLWGSVSDRLGRIKTFRILLASEIGVFVLLLFTSNHVVFFIAVCYVILCYGGGFGSMPSLVADTFGPKAMAKAYGAVLTAWGAAGVVGPLAAAYIRDRIPENFGPYLFGTAIAVLTLGFAVSYLDPGHGTKERKGSA